MTMQEQVRVALLLFGVALLPGFSQANDVSSADDNPLLPFERLIGGQWHLGDSFQEFEWGVGRRSVKARSYFIIDDEPKLVSEGAWYWHPESKVLKGTFTAIEMPVELFDYTTRFEENSMMSELNAYSSDGSRTAYVESWEFLDDANFVWTLYRKTSEGLAQEMQGTYSRTP